MAGGNEQFLIAGMRKDGPSLDRDIAKPDRAADLGERSRQFGLRLERDHAAIADPRRQPIDKTALVGADVADDIAGADVAPDDIELGCLIAKPRLQRPNPKPDAFIGKPGVENGH